MPEKFFPTQKILNILEKFTIELNQIRLDNLSSELYELIDILNLIKSMITENQFITEVKLIEINSLINEYIILFLTSVNYNPQLESLIQNNYNKLINMLNDEYNNNNIEDLYKLKYIKYKKKYIGLKKNI
jgi:hypothetical protein